LQLVFGQRRHGLGIDADSLSESRWQMVACARDEICCPMIWRTTEENRSALTGARAARCALSPRQAACRGFSGIQFPARRIRKTKKSPLDAVIIAQISGDFFSISAV
jgi:hypothetical protein